jgi:RNA polymerase sigma-70 factor (ECF subfamily)
MSLLTLRVRNWLRLLRPPERGTLTSVDAYALIATLTGERGRFVRMVRSRVATEADAEDVVQRAMTRAVERASQIEDATRARAWFYRLLRRAIADHHRSKPLHVSDEAIEHEPAGEDERPRPPACRCARRLLDDLRPTYAETMLRVDFNGEDPTAVADALRVSTANLYVRLHRARRALRERVQGHCGVTSIEPCLECMCHAQHRCAS